MRKGFDGRSGLVRDRLPCELLSEAKRLVLSLCPKHITDDSLDVATNALEYRVRLGQQSWR